MPVYVYECEKCGHREDDIEPINSPSVERECSRPQKPFDSEFGVLVPPKCDGMMRRIISAGMSFVFNCPMPTYQKPKT